MANRTRLVKVLMTEEEYQKLLEAAGKWDMTVSSFCREVLVEYYGHVPVGKEAGLAVKIPPYTDYAPPDWSMNEKAIAAGHVAELPKMTTEQVRVLKDQLSGPNVRPKKRDPKLCPHGKRAKVDNCWQCGGLAVFE